jgi:hypothetical protein
MWALEDIIARSRSAHARWERAMQMAERQMDPAMMVLLARLRDDLAEIERTAKDARNGEYYEAGQ